MSFMASSKDHEQFSTRQHWLLPLILHTAEKMRSNVWLFQEHNVASSTMGT